MNLRRLFRPRDVVVSRLLGGLGNQMFQYAAGLAVAQRTDCRLLLDTSRLRAQGEHTARPYALDEWRIQAELDTLGRVRLRNCMPIQEHGFLHQPDLLELAARGTRLNGYWQSEKYFAHLRPTLLQHFSLAQPPGPIVADLARRIQAEPAAVSLHFRRGDYITNSAAARHHGNCPMSYYEAALAQLRQQGQAGALFVFSDDPAWVLEQVPWAQDACVVDSAQSTAAQDIWLMSQCKHHIVANSSFSWWGAWLATREGRRFAPQRWFADLAVDDRDLVPAAWTRL